MNRGARRLQTCSPRAFTDQLVHPLSAHAERVGDRLERVTVRPGLRDRFEVVGPGRPECIAGSPNLFECVGARLAPSAHAVSAFSIVRAQRSIACACRSSVCRASSLLSSLCQPAM